jgi:hypothetical protein
MGQLKLAWGWLQVIGYVKQVSADQQKNMQRYPTPGCKAAHEITCSDMYHAIHVSISKADDVDVAQACCSVDETACIVYSCDGMYCAWSQGCMDMCCSVV